MIDRGPDKDRRWYKVFWTLYGIFLVLAVVNSLAHGATRFGLGDLLAPMCPAGIFTAIWWAFWGSKQKQHRQKQQGDQVIVDAGDEQGTRIPVRRQLRLRDYPTPTDDVDGQYWLTVLRDGTDSEKIIAREHLAGIFERRGMYAEAIELLSLNMQAGTRTSADYLWLAQLYRSKGENESAKHAEEAARLLDSVAKDTDR
jgi:hypothetical protein